jgi:hypothetical protein
VQKNIPRFWLIKSAAISTRACMPHAQQLCCQSAAPAQLMQQSSQQPPTPIPQEATSTLGTRYAVGHTPNTMYVAFMGTKSSADWGANLRWRHAALWDDKVRADRGQQPSPVARKRPHSCDAPRDGHATPRHSVGGRLHGGPATAGTATAACASVPQSTSWRRARCPPAPP